MGDHKEALNNYVEGFFGDYVQMVAEGAGTKRSKEDGSDGARGDGSSGDMDSFQAANDSNDKASGGKRIRTQDLRQQNARAQQRYRERQKSRQSDMQSKVEDLQWKLREMEEELAAKAGLESKVEVLEQKISIREYEISVLRREVATSKSANPNGSTPLALGAQMSGLASFDGGISRGLPPGMQMSAGVPSSRGPGSWITNETSSDMSGAAAANSKVLALPNGATGNGGNNNNGFDRILNDQSAAVMQAQQAQQDTGGTQKEQFTSLVDELQQQWLAQLSKLAETGIAVTSGKYCAEADLEKMVNETCDLCLRMRMTQDPSVTQLLKGGIGDHINMTQDQFNHWISVARRLLMQPIQIATLLQMRQATLKLLSDVYAKRELLNEDLAHLCAQGRAAALSIHDNNNDGGDGNSVSNGYSKLIPWAASVGTKGLIVFENLKSNLKEEQTILVEINMDFIHKVLTPSQSIRFMVDSYPDHAHALPLANAMAIARGEGGDKNSFIGNVSQGEPSIIAGGLNVNDPQAANMDKAAIATGTA